MPQPDATRRWTLGLVILFGASTAFLTTHAASAQSSADEQAATQRTEDADPAAATDDDGESSAIVSEEAAGRFQQLLERRPLHTAAFNGLVRHFAEQGKLAALVAEYEERVAALPDDAASKIVLVRLYLRTNQPDQATELLAKVGELPESLSREQSKWLAIRAEAFQRVGRLDDAKAVLNEAFAGARTIAERERVAEALADLHLRAGEKDQAAAVLSKLADEFADSYLHRKRLADALAQRELDEAAVGQYRAILESPNVQPDERCETLRDLGRSLERLGQSQQAIDAYTTAVGQLSSNHWLHQELHERIVQLYRAGGRLEELVQYCRSEIERAPDQTAMRILLADVLATSGEAEGAKTTLATAVELFPKDQALSERRVQLLERLGDEAGVAAEYERVISALPEDVENYINYGQYLAGRQHLEAARNQWRHVLDREVLDASLAARLGGLFEAYALFDDAVQCYERAITLAPQRPEGYTALARLWFYQGGREKALGALQRMASAQPDDAATHSAVCQAALGMGMNDEALAAIEKAVGLAPGHVDYRLVRANLLVQAGRLEDALAARREALGLIRNPVQLAQETNVLASMFLTANKLEALKDQEQKRLEADPKDTIALALLARAADFEKDFAGQRAWLNRLLEIEPAHENARHQLARLEEAVGDIDAAIAQYRRLIELHPARARQFYQDIADLRLRYNDRLGAVATFEQMVQAAPDNATVLKDVAEQLVRIGECDKGLALYEESLRIQSDRHDVRLAYGKGLVEAGRLDDAVAAFKSAALQTADRDTSAEALAKLHETAQRSGALDDMMDELQARLEVDPSDTLVTRTLAALLISEFEYNRAMELIDLTLRHQPRDAELQLIRAELLRRLARFDESVETYRRLLRQAEIDRDFVLGEMGKAFFEAGQLDQAKATWRQINHKLYAGSLLRNNGLLTEAVEVLQEGIRLQPTDYGLHRNLVRTLQAAGRVDEALEAARRLLDLEPDNVLNIRELAKAYLKRGNRAAAAEVAGRLFSAGVAEKKSNQSMSSASSTMGSSVLAASMQAAWGWYGGRSARNNLDAAVEFFRENGLIGELREVLEQQIAAQPDNAVLSETAVELFAEPFGKPERALELLKELETAEFPLEHQAWAGQCSQRDYYRMRQYQLIGSKPALRDQRLAVLAGKDVEALSRDELIELAIIRQALGSRDEAISLLKRGVEKDAGDVVALSALIDALVLAERFSEAEPYAGRIVEVLAAEREALRAGMIERVRRDFVRSLPPHLQMRVTEDLLADIADKWTRGQSFVASYSGGVQTMGYNRARFVQATICAKTGRMDEARQIWRELEPSHPADVDGWTTLAAVAQLHDQHDLAFEYYANALSAAKVMRGDQLYQRIYGGTLSQLWYGEGETIDTSFNKIVEAFAAHDRLEDLYDFLRETDQQVKARRVAEQYELYDRLKQRYTERLAAAKAEFESSSDDPLERSVPLFVEACKLAELHDATGDWPTAQKLYAAYLELFPDELGLLVTLSEVAERNADYEQAIAWEKKVVDAKERLARQARAWFMRELPITPAPPQVLKSTGFDVWNWSQRWGRQQWWYGGGRNMLDAWPSWVRIGQLFLAADNPIAAADALERAVGVAGSERESVARTILALIQERQLVGSMLHVLRSLAVLLPADENIQLAFAESLAANDRPAVATEVYKRLLRRGVSNVGTLAKIRQRLGQVSPDDEEAGAETLATLEAAVEADPSNAKKRLRLAKAYYYSLRIDEALAALKQVVETAPHLEGVHDLLVEVYTLQDDSDNLIEALRTKIQRVDKEGERQRARQRLVDELLTRGDNEAALKELKELADTKDPMSYQGVALLLHYFGRHDEAVEQFELAARSQSQGMWANDTSGQMIARSRLLQGDVEQAAEKILASIDQQLQQMVQYGGMASMFSMFMDQEQHFEPFKPLLALSPELADVLGAKLRARHEAAPDDPQAAKLLIDFYQAIGRTELADALLDEIAAKGSTDQAMQMRLIDQAAKRRDFERAIAMAKQAIAEQPKPQLPPGLPPQLAGMFNVMSPRNLLLCKLGDIYWQTNRREEAFEAYRQIVDEQVDETRLAFAAICLLRDRVDEARQLVEEALAKQQIKSSNLLQFRALLALIDNQPEVAFDALAQAAEAGPAESANLFMYGEGGNDLDLVASLAVQANLVDRLVEFVRTRRIAKNPTSWEDYQILVDTLFQCGRVDDAIALLDEAAKTHALRTRALAEKIRLREGTADDAELIGLYQQWLGLAEKQVKSSGWSRMFGMGRDDSAVDSSSQRQRLGDLLWLQGRHDEAVQAWTGRLDMNAAPSHIQLASRFLSHDARERAREAYLKAIELQPNLIAAHEALIALSFEQGDPGGAAQHLVEVFLKRYRPAPLPEEEEEVDPFQAVNYFRDYYDSQNRTRRTDSEMRRWAYELRKLPDGAASAEIDPEREPDRRLALHTLTGDWTEVEAELSKRLQSAPYDPMVWELWSIACERRGQWKEAARARERVRRLRQTTIIHRHEQLKLILAGEQIKDAAAGTKEADPSAPTTPTTSPSYYAQYYYQDYYYDRPVESDTQRLATLHIRAGDYAMAERLYLIGQRGNAVLLTRIADLLWEQGARERALELSRLGVIFGQQSSSVHAHARLLAEAGRVDEAADLLVRVYRGQAPMQRSEGLSFFYLGYMGGGAATPQFESDEEERTSNTLHDILQRSGKFTEKLAAWSKELEDNPDDTRLAKLVLSLQKRDRQWEDARERLAHWRSGRPEDSADISEELQVLVQLGDWAGARQRVAKLRELMPEREARWRMIEAFLCLAEGDKPGAVAAVEPLLDLASPAENVRPMQMAIVLASAGDHARLCRYFEQLEERGRLETTDALLLIRAQRLVHGDARALRTALKRLWRQVEPIEERSPLLLTIEAIVAAGAYEDSSAEPLSAEDEALITLLREGPAAGIAAFEGLVKASPDNLAARRGLIVAAQRGADFAKAAAVNAELLDWLGPRRRAIWDTPPRRSLQEAAQAFLKQAHASGLNANTVLSMGMSPSNLLQELLGEGGQAALRFDSLLAYHQELQRRLLARARQAKPLEALMLAQFREAQAAEFGPQTDEGPYTYVAYGGRVRRYYYRDPLPVPDWREQLRTIAYKHGLFELLCDEYTQTPLQVPTEQWPRVAEAFATVGDVERAVALRCRAAEFELAQLRASDAPHLSSESDIGYGWWYREDPGLEIEELRQALSVTLPTPHEKDDPDRPILIGMPGRLVQIAVLDPEVAGRLTALADQVGPGWGDCATVGTLVRYFLAARKPAEAVALLDRVFTIDELVRSSQVEAYLQACLETRDVARATKLLDEVVRVSADLANDVAVARLVAWRIGGNSAKADALEAELLSKCRRARPNPCLIDPRLSSYVSSFEMRDLLNFPPIQRIRPGRGFSSMPLMSLRFETLAELASAIGVSYQAEVQDGDLTLSRIYEAYASCGLHADAARIAELGLAEKAAGDRTGRLEVMTRIAMQRKLAELPPAAVATEEAVTALARELAEADPYEATPLLDLSRFYACECGTPDHGRALELLREAKRRDPAIDFTGLSEAGHLFELGDFPAAARLYQRGLARSLDMLSANILYQAGLAVARAGQREAALPLLRRALWCDPFHHLAAEARELTQ